MQTFDLLICPVTPFVQNCTIIWCTRTRHCAIVDPGGEAERLAQLTRERMLIPQYILLTHGHIDHAGGADELARALTVPIHGPHQDDAFLLQSLPEQGAMFGVGGSPAVTPARWFNEGDQVSVGDLCFDILHCPGHSPGHIVFLERNNKLLIGGDVVFSGSIGRTDLPGGNHRQLLDSIRSKLLPLDDDVFILPGHGPTTNIGTERQNNPFLRDML